MNFRDFFRELWKYDPFPWQEMLAERVVEGEWPLGLDLPTAAGKTASIDIAVFALATQADRSNEARTAPRRIWFVVDRRIVVDEAFERAKCIAKKLRCAKDGTLKEVADCLRELSGLKDNARPLATAKLRGGILKDDGWARIPSQPAVITSTVDQLGSNLLFRTYSHSQLAAPIFAGLAANDSLILLDEAHCSVPFSQTVGAIREFRKERWAEEQIPSPFSFAVLSATLGNEHNNVFPAKHERNAALDHSVLKERIEASKPAQLQKPLSSKKDDPLISKSADLALDWIRNEGKQRVAIIVNRVATAEALAGHLKSKSKDGEADVVLLTGRLRPYDRDQLVEKWTLYLRASHPEEPDRSILFVSTQCIEVGADFSFDGLITECASLDALRQRFGRLNRMGDSNWNPLAAILIRDPDTKSTAKPDPVYGTAMRETWQFLWDHAEVQGRSQKQMRSVDFGISAMDQLLAGELVEMESLRAPTADAPMLLPAHLDLFCQTSPTPHPEPDVSLFLHGKTPGAPEVRVLWRADLDEKHPEAWAEIVTLCPPNSLEMLSLPLYRLKAWLRDADSEDAGTDVEGIDPAANSSGSCRRFLCWRGRDKSRTANQLSRILPGDTIVLPASYEMVGLAQQRVDVEENSLSIDVWEQTLPLVGKRQALRLYPALSRQVPLDCEPFRDLLELATSEGWERHRIRELVDNIIALIDHGKAALPTRITAFFAGEGRASKIESYPGRGVILFGKKPAKRDSYENDLFADDDDLASRSYAEGVTLKDHTTDVVRAIEKIVGKCLPDRFLDPFRVAAAWHDAGKLDERFQLLLRGGDELAVYEGVPLAKSANVTLPPAKRRVIREATGLPDAFRHEMLSLQLAENAGAVRHEEQKMILHLIGSHHGYARPFAPVSDDKNPPGVLGTVLDLLDVDISAQVRGELAPAHRLDSGVSDRFWSLNQRFGWWGLAYLEAVFRLADWYASATEKPTK